MTSVEFSASEAHSPYAEYFPTAQEMSELGFQVASILGIKGCATTVFSHIWVSVWLREDAFRLQEVDSHNPSMKIAQFYNPVCAVNELVRSPPLEPDSVRKACFVRKESSSCA